MSALPQVLPARGATSPHESGPISRPRPLAPAAPAHQTTFQRVELKYWVTEGVAERLARFAQPYLELDPYSRAGIRTRNVSLYLDTRGLACLHAHLDSAPDRFKLRVRGYGDPPRGAAFFEVKRKVKNITLKTRATLPVVAVPGVLGGRHIPVPGSFEERRYLDEFVLLQRKHRCEPTVMVAAYREAYVSRLGQDVRMTIDREIVYQRPRGVALAPRPGSWTSVPGPDASRSWYGRRRALVELKTSGPVPVWMTEMVAQHGLRPEAFSKYVSAMLHLRRMR